jgi:hypothetical protein
VRFSNVPCAILVDRRPVHPESSLHRPDFPRIKSLVPVIFGSNLIKPGLGFSLLQFFRNVLFCYYDNYSREIGDQTLLERNADPAPIHYRVLLVLLELRIVPSPPLRLFP